MWLLPIKGVIVPLITPIRDDQIRSIDLHRLIDHVINGGCDAIFILGTTGEFQYLSLYQKEKLIWQTVEYTNNRVPLLVGISSMDPQETMTLLCLLQKINVSGVVLSFLDLEHAEQLFEIVASVSEVPIILYNNPDLQHNSNLEIDFVRRAAMFAPVMGIKDSSGNWNYFCELLSLKSPSFSVYQGRSGFILESLDGGASGLVSGYANVYPELLKRLYLERSKRFDTEINKIKRELGQLSPNQINAMKLKLEKMGVIG